MCVPGRILTENRSRTAAVEGEFEFTQQPAVPNVSVALCSTCCYVDVQSLPRSVTRRQHWPLLDIFRDTLSQSCPCSDHSPTGQPTANMLRRHEELENGTAWSNSSESSDDSSSPRLSVGGLRNSTHP
ncbi:hypothetical protein FQN60_014625, partial [Etheostoma spectabile]